MQIEYEATFENINKDEVREKLRAAGAQLKREEFEQKRVVFNLPSGHEIQGAWLRVRDEGNKVTCSLKVVNPGKIEGQKEIQIDVSDFDTASELLESVGAQRKAFQVSRREIWELDGVEVMIDEWPWLEPFVEVEGESEDEVRQVSEKLGFEWSKALFCAAGDLYVRQYGIELDQINNQTPLISFDAPNPFIED